MEHLFTLVRHKDIEYKGSTLFRKAYRAIVIKDDLVLMIKSKKYGEYKFPGGGKEGNESAFEVIYRETLEETGYKIKSKITPFGWTMEYAKDFEGVFDIFQQESRYYICHVHKNQGEMNLSSYEIEYGYTPIWVSLEEAIRNNENIQTNDWIPWKERDTLVMKKLLEMRDSH